MGIRALAALVARFHIFFGVIPQASGVGHEQSEQKAADDVAKKETADGGRSADEAHKDGGGDGYKSGRNQFL